MTIESAATDTALPDPPECTAVADADSVVALMRRLAAAVADDGAAGWAAVDRQGVLSRLGVAINGLTTVRGSVLVAEKASQGWKDTGAASFEKWVADQFGDTNRATGREVREAEKADAVPAVRAQVVAGTIGTAHARIIADLAANGTPAQRAAVATPAGQALLLEWASTQGADTFAITVATWAATIDPDGLERDLAAQQARRFFHVSQTPDGTVVKGRLDTTTGRYLVLALEALTPTPAAGDDRDLGERQADALTTMATTIIGLAQTTPGAHVPPQVSFILTETTWLAATAESDRRRNALTTFGFPLNPNDDTGDTGAEADAVVPVGYPPATWEDGTPVPYSVIATTLCDCELTRIVIDADAAPVNLGRSQRLYTGVHRRAVIARDRHCAWPGCTMNARWCQVHHLQHWGRDHGETSIDNGALLCNYHHHETHRRDLTLTRHPTPHNTHGPALVTYQLHQPTPRQHGRDPGCATGWGTGRGTGRGTEHDPGGEVGGEVGRSRGQTPPPGPPTLFAPPACLDL